MTKKHILIVDDDYRILKLLQKFFKQNNFIVSTATSAEEASDLITRDNFDLLILDIMLPGITGIEFAKNIRDGNDKTPIIMLTALVDPDTKEDSQKAGIDYYMIKPFEPLELLKKVKNLLDCYYDYNDIDEIK